MTQRQDEHPSRNSKRVAFRIGPFVLAASCADGPLAPAPGPGQGNALDRALGDFQAPEDAAADLELTVVRAEPEPRPGGEPVYKHRAGWDVFRAGDALLAIKAIPYGSDRILRSVRVGAGGGEGVLRISPEDGLGSFPFVYTLSELLALLATRASGAALVHAASVEVGGEALLFTGASGSGKSTMAELWRASGRGAVLGDESHLIWRDEEGGLFVGGTPWPGSSGLYSNRSARLGGVFFIEHGERNVAQPIGAADAMVALLSHSYLPNWDAESMEIVADLARDVAAGVPCSRLAFVPDGSVVDFVCCL